MKKTWSQPGLIEYGRIGELTLGQHGTLPDYNTNGGLIANDNCTLSDPNGKGSDGDSNPFVCLT